MRIGEFAARTEVSAHTLRYWEQRGLLADPGRTPAGYRDYPPESVERVAFVRRAQAAGLSLEQIKVVLDLDDRGERPCPRVADFVDQRLAEVDAHLAALTDTRQRLAALRHRLDLNDHEDVTPGGVRAHICPSIQGS